MLKHILLASLFGYMCCLFPTTLQSEEWKEQQRSFILKDTIREVNCSISHPRQQIHLYRVQLIIFHGNTHQEYTALIVYRHERYFIIEGAQSYSRFREHCGSPQQYEQWFP